MITPGLAPADKKVLIRVAPFVVPPGYHVLTVGGIKAEPRLKAELRTVQPPKGGTTNGSAA
jgi:hypothetical protein